MQMNFFDVAIEESQIEEKVLPIIEVEEVGFIEPIVPYQIGDKVHGINPVESECDVETFFYLQDFKGKPGIVVKVIESAKLQYEVEYKNRIACVYHHELNFGW